MAHDPASRIFLPLTVPDALGMGTIGTFLAQPIWVQWLKDISTDAALIAPILLSLWTAILIVDKLWLMFLRARAVNDAVHDEDDLPRS